MPITGTGSQLPSEGSSGGGWWNKFTEGVKSSNFTFTSGHRVGRSVQLVGGKVLYHNHR